MKRTFKKSLSIILAAAIMLCSAPLTGLLDLELPDFGGFEKLADSVSELFDSFTPKAKAATSGTCGDNLTWTFNESTGELVISGTGDMYNYDYDNRHWESYEDNIKSVTIGNSVTSIGDHALSGCDSLTSVTIPDSVTSIGNQAFHYCTSLTSITIPDSVTSIGYYAFCDCESLTSISVGSANTSYSSDEYGVLFNKDKTKLIQYPIGNTRTSYVIPDSVTSIGDDAFCDCESLTSITIPDGVTSIGDSAFCTCTSLTSVTIPDSATNIGGLVFSHCYSLTSITIPDSATNIGGSAFYHCESLTSVTLGNSVTSIGSFAFYYCTSLTSITIPDSVTSIGTQAFYHCDSLTSVTIGNSVTSIGNSAFGRCTSLTSITIPDSATNIGGSAFEFCDSLTSVTIGNSVTSIGSSAFFYCDSLTSITIPDSVTSIGRYAFSYCDSLTSITIPDSVTSIGEVAFYHCDSLTDIYYTGTEEEWNAISIFSGNAPLLNATIHFNSATGGEENEVTELTQIIDFNTENGEGSVEVTFKDKWFEKSNEEYNHELAKFCADYVMMGYCYNDDIKDYLSLMGFDKVDRCMSAGRDEVNYFIASKNIMVSGETKTLVFAGFIGSYKDQWYSNFDPYATQRGEWENRNAQYTDINEKGKVHLGFADAKEYVYERLKEHIEDLNINDKGDLKLLISGHSRGAATANLLSAKLINEAYGNSSEYLALAENIYTYTFATPNTTADINANEMLYDSIFNIVNPEDFVTKVLPKAWGYSRYGITYVLPSRTNDTQKWKTYLNAMRPYYAQFKSGLEYEPYNGGEKTTYKIVKKFTESIKNLDEFYKKDILAYISHNILGLTIYNYMVPYDFFRCSVLPIVSKKDIPSGVIESLNCLSGTGIYDSFVKYFINIDFLNSYNLPGMVLPIAENLYFTQAHCMETYAAYMNAMTSSQIKQTRLYYENTVNCPVDIEIYDNATNELVGKITNNVIDETISEKENAIVMDVEGDSKSFYLPSNGDYRIVLTGNDNGTMDYSVSSIDSDTGETERLNFFDVEIENGVSMEGEINAEEFVLEEYTLNHEENGVIEPTEKLEGDELQDVSVNTTSEGAGYADGSITVTSGDYVTVTATANENNNFIGWYENGVLVSNDAEYSFVAKENRNLVAKFTNNYAIEWNVDGEITTTYCEAGSAITTLENPVKSGYKFIGWTPAIPNVMPAENLSFTAVWGPLFTSEIRKPSTTTINYGDSIILHADISGELPSGYYVEWTASNNNFSYKANGATCEISPEKSGDTTFTATIYDADGNPVSTDEQTMTSKAGFFQKIIAFFKKLFGLTKTIPNVFEL